MNLSAIDLILERCEEAVAFGEPMLDCSFIAKTYFCGRGVVSTKFRARAMPPGKVMNASVRILRRYSGMKVGQVIKPARGPHGGKVRSIEAKETHARLPVMSHVSADVEFREARQAGQRRQSAAVNSAHAEWNNSDPALAVVGVESQLQRDERPD